MKKLIAILLALAVVGVFVAGCGASEDETEEPTNGSDEGGDDN